MQSQVKIGEEVAPTPGAVLDLKKTQPAEFSYIGGLLLPHVEIVDLDYIPETFSDYEEIVEQGTTAPGKGKDINIALRGMIVYNTKADTGTTGAGIYY